MGNNQNKTVKRPKGRPKRDMPYVPINFHLDEDLYTIAKMRCETYFTRYLNDLIRKALMTE